MIRNIREVKETDERYKWRVHLQDIPTVIGTAEAAYRQMMFLQEILEQPALLQCGPYRFQKMTMWHNGNAWICEAEAVGAKQ